MKCLSEGCEKEVVRRGVCNTCYQAFRNMVVARQSTWEEMESLKLVLGKNSERRSKAAISLAKARAKKAAEIKS